VFWVADGDLYLQAAPQLLLALPGFLIVMAMAIGMSLWTSVLNAKARDVRYLLRYVLPVWLYLTPVVYPASLVPADYRWLTWLNPMSGPIELIKVGLLGTGEVAAAALISGVGFAAVAMGSGLWFFSREAPRSIEREEPDDAYEDEMAA
jgi:lipopolysaccharide transport system permease protein